MKVSVTGRGTERLQAKLRELAAEMPLICGRDRTG